jgi:hypothetical protein
MPVIIPPTFHDIPAVVSIAAHSAGSSAIAGHIAGRPPAIIQPNSTVQGPTVTPPTPPVTTKTDAAGAAGRVTGKSGENPSR